MSYFNPKIYNKQNLKQDDLDDLEFWNSIFVKIISNANDGFYKSGSPTFDKMRQEIIDDFCKQLRTALGYEMQNITVAFIDDYGEEVVERDEYDTFLYYDGEDDE